MSPENSIGTILSFLAMASSRIHLCCARVETLYLRPTEGTIYKKIYKLIFLSSKERKKFESLNNCVMRVTRKFKNQMTRLIHSVSVSTKGPILATIGADLEIL